jgi:hypothetical protein
MTLADGVVLTSMTVVEIDVADTGTLWRKHSVLATLDGGEVSLSISLDQTLEV